jgi:lysyl-tRNA synthetase, class II
MIGEEAQRRARLQKLREAGHNPYPSCSERDLTTVEFLAQFDALEKSKEPKRLVGRVRAFRKHGGLTFMKIQDGAGSLQIVIMKDIVGEEQYAWLHQTTDVGDFVQVSGVPFVTKKGENSLQADEVKIISKALLPLPEKWHGLSDVEIRYRKRHLDLIANEHVRAIFKTRAKVLSTIRAYLDRHECMEVETPVLQAVPGGASARPFITHHNALDIDMYLRIAPELFLKRCVAGGYERVYEVARCFRNEGIDHAHNPEFTQVECYVAYMDYQELMVFVEKMVIEVIEACGLDAEKLAFKDMELNFKAPWQRMTFRDAVLKYAEIDIEEYEDRDMLAKVAMKKGVPVEKTDSLMSVLDNIYKHFVRPAIEQPTYIYDYPASITPLAKRKAEDPRYAEMFQLVFGKGEENIKAFSELNDPIDQEERFNEQTAAREAGDEEAQFGDDDFVEVLKNGMPPTAGFGIGIDRLVAMLTNSHSIKEVILFPTLRPEREE